MSEPIEECSKGYRLLDGRCVAKMSEFRTPIYNSIFGDNPVPNPPTPPPTPTLKVNMYW